MLARSLLAAVAFLVAPVTAAMSAAASANDLTIVTRDQEMQRAVQSALVQPFTAITDFPVQQEIWEGGIDTLRSRAKAPDNSWALVVVDPEELVTGCAEGIFERLDWSTIGGKDHYMQLAVSDCGLGAIISNTVLAWDRDKFPVTPNWSDFWDVAKYPGKRGLRKGVRGNLEIALLADGVPPGDVYKTLSTSDGVERAFRKLDQLKPYIVWWAADAEAAHILSSGDVLMTSAPSGQIVTTGLAEHRNFGLQFASSLFEVLSWAIMKGTPSLRMAQQFLYLTGLPAIELRLLRNAGDSALAKGLNDGLPPELLAMSPSNPANLAISLRSDVGFWHDNLPKLRQRFDTWLDH